MLSPVPSPQSTPAATPAAHTAAAVAIPRLGTRVRIERDERRYPSKGTWPQFRGKTGIVVEHNLGEIGVALGAKTYDLNRARPGHLKGNAVTWFQPYEITVIE